MTTPMLLTIAKVQEVCGVSRRTVYRWVADGLMPPPVRIGGSLRWRVSQLEIWVQRGCPRWGGGKRKKR
jgi:excisionase family DNA binding protein